MKIPIKTTIKISETISFPFLLRPNQLDGNRRMAANDFFTVKQ